jgi:hypothetical protein
MSVTGWYGREWKYFPSHTYTRYDDIPGATVNDMEDKKIIIMRESYMHTREEVVV